MTGITWGVFQTLAATYAADVMPATLRVYLLSNINMGWLLGQLCGILILRGAIGISSPLSYRIPLALQWAFASVILAGIFFAPESPCRCYEAIK